MSVVTSFESGLLDQAKAQAIAQKFDYEQVREALKQDLEAVENAYARCAKRHFKSLLGGETRMRMPDQEPPHPFFWVSGSDIVIDFVDGDFECFNLERLAQNTEALAALISSIRQGQPIALVGALNTKVQQIGPKIFAFKLKQKWGLDARR